VARGTDNEGETGLYTGTAFPIARTSNGDYVALTARHNYQNSKMTTQATYCIYPPNSRVRRTEDLKSYAGFVLECEQIPLQRSAAAEPAEKCPIHGYTMSYNCDVVAIRVKASKLKTPRVHENSIFTLTKRFPEWKHAQDSDAVTKYTVCDALLDMGLKDEHRTFDIDELVSRLEAVQGPDLDTQFWIDHIGDLQRLKPSIPNLTLFVPAPLPDTRGRTAVVITDGFPVATEWNGVLQATAMHQMEQNLQHYAGRVLSLGIMTAAEACILAFRCSTGRGNSGSPLAIVGVLALEATPDSTVTDDQLLDAVVRPDDNRVHAVVVGGCPYLATDEWEAKRKEMQDRIGQQAMETLYEYNHNNAYALSSKWCCEVIQSALAVEDASKTVDRAQWEEFVQHAQNVHGVQLFP